MSLKPIMGEYLKHKCKSLKIKVSLVEVMDLKKNVIKKKQVNFKSIKKTQNPLVVLIIN